ncbi:vitamin B12-dependent ribonucleotide reductase [Frankia sp. B2]|uniref:Vitamin B12-dependent ribonucleotide reductase n=2 Tax=Frankia casuarinae (strain DSM 45818 / CECT 9043 / HFP020203 / CcI3) TaxID=106370 RepID=Q2J782_FRACC|nr:MULTISPECIES: vitamin B12-dependent ribonucleotide reductase [Frankia]ABD12860.1 Ribonucleoside diphosphate reductase, B12-dependent [Frankia casuarinae]KDA43644.1 ribonucleoside-diphosphate reductase class II [Frankia sp. BMG5.23]TFE27304.1 vitamin B12-dependent ribonucleotide reductase [Frankia sp. B2]
MTDSRGTKPSRSAAKASGLKIQRSRTTAGVHPYDEVTWESRDVVMTNWRDGSVNFEQRGVEFPQFWSVNASNIVTSKYFRGAPGTPGREWSLRQLIDRVVHAYGAAGREHGYFASDTDAEIFEHELTWMLLHQVFSFNSPVWFNVGTPAPQQVSACQPYDALVSTPSGLVPIGALVETDAVGMKVFDAHGLTQVIATKSNGVKDVLRIWTRAGHALDVTADHLVWRSTSAGAGAFVPAGALRAGDTLEWHRTIAPGEGEITSREIAEAALAGRLQADGFVGRYAGTNASLTIEAMTVPTRLYDAPLPVVAAYLRSLFQADGYVSRRERSTLIGLDMISEGLIRGVQGLLARFGIFARVRREADPRPDRHDLWSLGIQNAGDRRTFADEIGFLDPVKAAKLEASFDQPGQAAKPVKRLQIERIEPRGPMPVYDIQTDSGEYLSAGLRVHNCFILSVDDTMESILNWYREEGLIFKGGSGAGLNLSRIRSSKELLSSGGTASGPVSFMRGADASAGTIKSGGATRRAAKMVVLDVDHPDIVEFVETKAREEDKIRALRDAGFDMDLGGRDIASVQYQNANNSVRVTDEFMRAVVDGGGFDLRARLDGRVLETVDARGLFHTIAEAAWACADPGIQYDGTINDWHTCPESGRISASNPCSEYVHLDNSSCNLASLNLLKFLRPDRSFDAEAFVAAVELIITAMDISICFADFPTPEITRVSRAYRQLGIGYANLGALLMASARAYDSDGGRALAASITSLMTATAYRRSAELAGIVGAYDGFARNADAHRRVMRKHAAANDAVRSVHAEDSRILAVASREWARAQTVGEKHGWRNAQASLLAPTGTIGLAMDCDTTGIEPDLALVKMKKLVGGASMRIVNQTVPAALQALGYPEETIEAIVEYIAEYGHVIDAPGLRPEHYEVFDCAIGERAISPMGHVRMMAAVQPFLSGAISKTVNMPSTATVAEVEQIYLEGWRLGLKALAIYRDNCKVGQPLTDVKGAKQAAELAATRTGTGVGVGTGDAVGTAGSVGPAPVEVEYRPVRRRLPKTRPSRTVSFSVGGAEGYLTAGSYPDDGLGEVFIKMSKQGSTLAGVMDAFAIAISIGLQYGVPLEAYVSKFINMRFEPAGMTDDPDVRIAQSIMDYLFRRLALDYLDADQRAELGISTAADRARRVAGQYGPAPAVEAARSAQPAGIDGPAGSQGAAVTGSSASVADRGDPGVPPGPAVGNGPAYVARELRLAPPGESLVAQTVVDAPLCFTCGVTMRPAGSCYVCEQCGSTSGCS